MLAGNFPSTNATTGFFLEAARLNSSTVTLSYIDSAANSSWVYIQIYHRGFGGYCGFTVKTGNVLLIVWDLAQEGVDYFVYVQSYSGGELHTWVLPTSRSYSDF